MRFQHKALAGAILLVLVSAPAGAVSLGMTDSFEDGTLMGWSSGDANPTPPVNVATGGPAGADDNYMLLTASGFSGPGGKLVAFAGPQWTSSANYLAAGVTALGMDVDNLGSTEIDLRLYIVGSSGASVISKNAIVLAPGSGWQHVSFSLAGSAFTGPSDGVLSSVAQIRLFHGTTAAFPGPNIAARLGVDNVSAVPEPAPWLGLGAGLALLALRRRSA